MISRSLGVVLLPLFLATNVGALQGDKFPQEKAVEKFGVYEPPPKGLVRLRVGMPEFKVSSKIPREIFDRKMLAGMAADQLVTMADRTKRFRVLERVQFKMLIKEQGLERARLEELVKPGRVRGVDLLFVAKLVSIEVSPDAVQDWKDPEATVTATCSVDLRLVNTKSGKVVLAKYADYRKTTTMKKFGFKAAGAVDVDERRLFKITKESTNLLLRLTLDRCLKNMIKGGVLDKRLMALRKK